jgi:hypothetical protein
VSSRFPSHPPDETILYTDVACLSAVYGVCVWGWEPPKRLIESSISVRAAGGGAPFWVPPAGSPVRLIHLAPVLHPLLIEARRSGAERISGGLDAILGGGQVHQILQRFKVPMSRAASRDNATSSPSRARTRICSSCLAFFAMGASILLLGRRRTHSFEVLANHNQGFYLFH